jgi:gamma-glutamyltranspeptidase/glutathione hydrolase
MAPTLVFAAGGGHPGFSLQMAVGSAGGTAIINYVAKTLVAAIDWKQGMQQAVAAPNMGSRNRETEIERGSALEGAAAALRAMGHPVAVVELVSGTQGIARTPRGLTGGADPRREGVAALGNTRAGH